MDFIASIFLIKIEHFHQYLSLTRFTVAGKGNNSNE